MTHQRKRIIFLDIDGVLNNWESMQNDTWGHHTDYRNWEPSAVELLNELCIYAEAQVVISSSWRMLSSNIEWWNAQFAMVGVGSIEVVDVTPRSHNGYRGREIKYWIAENECDSYVILDDESDFYSYQPRVFIDAAKGFLSCHLQEAKDIFDGKHTGTNNTCMVERRILETELF